jgi:tetratricopeptide (TPR) repeat protein
VGNNAQAEELFRQSIRSDPKFAKGYLSLGGLLAGESRSVEAKKTIEEGLRIDPGNRQMQALREQILAQTSP